MSLTTGWVKPPTAITGQDHLATITTCGALYAQLVPGITNVTDRARCYSFYPWFFWAIDQANLPRDQEALVQTIRLAECLWCLIGINHEAGADSWTHGGGLAGREKLIPAWREIMSGGSLKLSTYATTEETSTRYFKNKLGGFDQYYLGTLSDLYLLAKDAKLGIRYDRNRVTPLAEAFAAKVDGRQFFRVLQEDKVTKKTLDRLASFCPCQLASNQRERDGLLDLFFNRPGVFFDEANQPRRLTLVLLLELASHLQENLSKLAPEGLDMDPFRACVYTGALPNGKLWSLPAALEEIRRKWAVYQRSELLSLAVQGIFWAVLTAMSESKAVLHNATEVGRWFAMTFGRRGILERPREPFSKAVARVRHVLPPLKAWGDPAHEIQRSRALLDFLREPDPKERIKNVVKSALYVLLALLARDDSHGDPYKGFVFSPDFFPNYPINLLALRDISQGEWKDLDMKELLGWLVERWCIGVHFRVALRKLRHEDRDTFRVRPTELGLRVVEPWPPTPSRPRFGQAFRILCDLGALDVEADTGRTVVTSLGTNLLASLRA